MLAKCTLWDPQKGDGVLGCGRGGGGGGEWLAAGESMVLGVGHSVKASPQQTGPPQQAGVDCLAEGPCLLPPTLTCHFQTDTTSKQTRLAKVGTGEDGLFLPAGNDIESLASFNIVRRVTPMPPGSLPVLHSSLLRRKKSLFSSVLQQCLEDLEIATYNRLVIV